MKHTRLAIVIAGILAVSGAFYGSMKWGVVTTRDVYDLSGRDLENLKRRVEAKGDGTAAQRISLYYERTVKDADSMLVWRKKAADLGEPSAKQWMDHDEELVKKAEEGAL